MPGSAEVDWARYVAVKVQWIYNVLNVALQRGCCLSRASTSCQPRFSAAAVQAGQDQIHHAGRRSIFGTRVRDYEICMDGILIDVVLVCILWNMERTGGDIFLPFPRRLQGLTLCLYPVSAVKTRQMALEGAPRGIKVSGGSVKGLSNVTGLWGMCCRRGAVKSACVEANIRNPIPEIAGCHVDGPECGGVRGHSRPLRRLWDGHLWHGASPPGARGSVRRKKCAYVAQALLFVSKAHYHNCPCRST